MDSLNKGGGIAGHMLEKLSKRVNDLSDEKVVRAEFRKEINRRMKTTIISSLDAVEKGMGHLFGIGLPPEELTEEQVAVRKQWEIVRDTILNKGNAQLRQLLIYTDDLEVKRKSLTVKIELQNERTQK